MEKANVGSVQPFFFDGGAIVDNIRLELLGDQNILSFRISQRTTPFMDAIQNHPS
jgi:hypothetical protein